MTLTAPSWDLGIVCRTEGPAACVCGTGTGQRSSPDRSRDTFGLDSLLSGGGPLGEEKGKNKKKVPKTVKNRGGSKR